MKLKLRIVKQEWDDFHLQEKRFFFWRDVTYERLKELSGITSLIYRGEAIVKSEKEENLHENIKRIKNYQRKKICEAARFVEVVYQEEIIC